MKYLFKPQMVWSLLSSVAESDSLEPHVESIVCIRFGRTQIPMLSLSHLPIKRSVFPRISSSSFLVILLDLTSLNTLILTTLFALSIVKLARDQFRIFISRLLRTTTFIDTVVASLTPFYHHRHHHTLINLFLHPSPTLTPLLNTTPSDHQRYQFVTTAPFIPSQPSVSVITPTTPNTSLILSLPPLPLSQDPAVAPRPLAQLSPLLLPALCWRSGTYSSSETSSDSGTELPFRVSPPPPSTPKFFATT